MFYTFSVHLIPFANRGLEIGQSKHALFEALKKAHFANAIIIAHEVLVCYLYFNETLLFFNLRNLYFCSFHH